MRLFEKLLDRWLLYAVLLGLVLGTLIEPIPEIEAANRAAVIPLIILMSSTILIFLPFFGYRLYALTSALVIITLIGINSYYHQRIFIIDTILFLIILLGLCYEIFEGDNQKSGITFKVTNLLMIVLGFVAMFSIDAWYGPDFIWFRILPLITSVLMISYPLTNRVTLRLISITTLLVIIYHTMITYQTEKELVLLLISLPHIIICSTALLRSLNLPTTEEIAIRIRDWYESSSEPPLELLDTYGDISAKMTIHPWVSNPEKFIPRHYRKEILQGLDRIYTSWDEKRHQYSGHTDLQLWIFDSYMGLSEIVCAKVERAGYIKTSYFDPVPESRRLSTPPKRITSILKDYSWSCFEVIDRQYDDIDDLTKMQIRRLRQRGYEERNDGQRVFYKAIDTVWVGRKK